MSRKVGANALEASVALGFMSPIEFWGTFLEFWGLGIEFGMQGSGILLLGLARPRNSVVRQFHHPTVMNTSTGRKKASE